MKTGTKVYFYMINNGNEAYKKFRQVGLENVNKSNEMIIVHNPSMYQFSKAFTTSYKPDKCIECIFMTQPCQINYANHTHRW